MTICHVGEITNRRQKKVLDLKLELQTIGSCLMWVLWTELRSSRKTFQCMCMCVHTRRGQVNFRCYFSKNFPSFFSFKYPFPFLFICCVCHVWRREENFLEVVFLPPCSSWGSNSGHQVLPNTFIQ